MGITIICPIYNAENYLESLHNSILMQENVNIDKILYLVTESDDQTLNIVSKLKFAQYTINNIKNGAMIIFILNIAMNHEVLVAYFSMI